MTLEDFFTLSEMKDGLTALARVEELVSIMQKEKDSVVKNVAEAARQWSTVASTLAATENKDCLDLFIRIGGLRFVDQWLQEAQKCSNDISENFVEESIAALLGALKKLPVDERSISSGIGVSVKNLFGHKSSSIQDKARVLFDSWSQGKSNNAVHLDVRKAETCCDDDATATVAAESGCSENSAVDVSLFEGSAGKDNSVSLLAGDELQNSRCSDGSQSEFVKEVKISMSNNQGSTHTTLCLAEDDGFQEDALGSSVMSEPCQESLSVMEKSSIPFSEGTATTKTQCPVQLKDNVEGKSSCVPELKGLIDDAKVTDLVNGSPDKLGKKETSSVSTSFEQECVSSTSNPEVQQSVMEPAIQSNVDAKESEFCVKVSPLGLDCDASPLGSTSKIGNFEFGLPKHSRGKLELKDSSQGVECLSSSVYNLRKKEDPEMSLSREKDAGAVNGVKELAGESILKVRGGAASVILGTVSGSTRNLNDTYKIDEQSKMELEYGVDDALEVAFQVAKEVEREVVDYREPFCSTSSEKNSEGGVVQPTSPDSINGEQDQLMTGLQNELPTGQNLPGPVSSPEGEEHLINSKNMDNKPEDFLQEPSSHVTEAAQEPASTSEKSLWCFDLNQEIFSEEMDHPSTPVSAPVLVVASSKAVVCPGLPVAPLHFEGTLGWKGSAATSAFRPASARRTPDCEKAPSVEGSSYSSKQRQDFLDIDLNVAGGDDGVTDPVFAKQTPVSSGLPSGESSVEVSSRRAERLKLDLNCVGDNEDAPSSDWRMDQQFFYNHRSGHRSPSPASSSSSRRLSMKNIDLNDSPSVFDDSYVQRPDLGKAPVQNINAYGGSKMHEPVISIMGTMVEVNRKDTLPQTRAFLPNRQVEESMMGANLTRSGCGVDAMAYTPPPPFYGYNSLMIGPSMSLSPAMYGPGAVPYMVDSRGAPVVPQIMGSPAAVPPTYSQQQFVLSMTGPPSGFNGVGTTRPSLDLNSGVMTADTESRDPGGLRQLFIPGQVGLMEEQMRSLSQPLNSGMGVKRKEPDGGWDLYSFGYKPEHPWHHRG